ncbi:hypothetical protein V1523DRAFT_428905 [Lipomyces doorenjongii]
MRLRSRNILTPPPLEAPALEEAEVVSREPSVLEALPVMVSGIVGRSVRSYLAATNVLSAIDNNITVDQMDAKALQADNVAKGIIIGHVSNLMMLTLTMFERAYDMYSYLKERYTAKAADRQARYNQLEINPPGHSYEIDS